MSRAVRRRWATVPVAAALGIAGVGCTGPGASGSGGTPSPFAGCAGLAAPPSASAGSPAAAPTDLPELRLPCFTGGQPVDVSAIRGPAVLTFWASSCLPCRTELPVMQQLADRTAGRLHVIGVDTGDRREAGASFAADHRVTLPTLFDAEQKLLRAVGGRALPTTVFVDAAGRRSVYLLPLDAPGLAEQVRAHTGVTVPS